MRKGRSGSAPKLKLGHQNCFLGAGADEREKEMVHEDVSFQFVLVILQSVR